MTTLNPSHNIFREPEGRHAQAVRQADAASGSGSDVDGVDGDLDSRPQGVKRAKRHGRKRVKAAMPPIPDMRFEQSYLLSIRPYLTPRPSKAETAERGPVEEGKESKSLVSSTEQDEVFHWGRQVDVNWRMVAYVTFRDQFLSPMVQGALWGWGTLLLAGTGATIRQFLYPARHVPKGRITGGPGGKISEAGAGSAVGGGGWWRKFVGSWAGAVETATV